MQNAKLVPAPKINNKLRPNYLRRFPLIGHFSSQTPIGLAREAGITSDELELGSEVEVKIEFEFEFEGPNGGKFRHGDRPQIWRLSQDKARVAMNRWAYEMLL